MDAIMRLLKCEEPVTMKTDWFELKDARLQLNSFADHPLVGEVCGVGLIGALELVKDKKTRESFDPKLAVGPNLIRIAHDHGVILRPVADSICFCPPLICTEAQLREMFDKFRKALADTQAWVKAQAVAA